MLRKQTDNRYYSAIYTEQSYWQHHCLAEKLKSAAEGDDADPIYYFRTALFKGALLRNLLRLVF